MNGHEIASPHCRAEHALMIRSQPDHRSTLTGGGHHGIEHRFESPKHRDSLVLSMNSYVQRTIWTCSNENSVPNETNTYVH